MDAASPGRQRPGYEMKGPAGLDNSPAGASTP